MTAEPHTQNGDPSRIRVAYQGEAGAYSEQAALQFFESGPGSSSVDFLPCATFTDMFQALGSGRVDRAAVPIENSLAGTIHENLDHLLRHPQLTVVGELDFRVRHCLLALPKVSLSDITLVRSHPMALAQCTNFFHDSGIKSEVAFDTAGSAKLIRKEGLTDVAAIASSRAAQIYDLQILAESIQDEQANYTRFLIVSPTRASPYIPSISYKTSLAFCLDNSPGCLCRALSVFGVTNIDLTKIESRHIHTVRKALGPPFDEDRTTTERWGYVFYVDFSRHADEEAVAAALNHLQHLTTFYRLLGTYPAHPARS